MPYEYGNKKKTGSLLLKEIEGFQIYKIFESHSIIKLK